MKKVLFSLLISLSVMGNANAQKHKRTMKPKKKACLKVPCCAEPSSAPFCDTLGVDTLEAKMFETVEGLKPSFPGDLDAFIASNLQYPPELSETCVIGRVLVKFFVTPSGNCCLFRVMRSVDPLLDKEALRALKRMPVWRWERKPAKGVWWLVAVDFRF